MASKYEKFVNWIDPSTGAVECIFCGKKWLTMRGRHRLQRGALICPNGCTSDYDEAHKRWTKSLFTVNPISGKFESVALSGQNPKWSQETIKTAWAWVFIMIRRDSPKPPQMDKAFGRLWETVFSPNWKWKPEHNTLLDEWLQNTRDYARITQNLQQTAKEYKYSEEEYEEALKKTCFCWAVRDVLYSSLPSNSRYNQLFAENIVNLFNKPAKKKLVA